MPFNVVPLSLYIHIPWCVKKCPYCDFNSHHQKGELPEAAYIDALIQDLKQSVLGLNHKQLTSVFFGGGTPSLLSPRGIARILQAVDQLLCINKETEITLEANPGTVEQNKFKGFKAAGVNRISLGVQSFNDTLLKRLGRIHDGENAKKAIQALIIAGFENYNLDLMFGLPMQTQLEAMEDLKQAISFSPPHLSWYQLTLEPNTEFYRNPPQLPNEDALYDIHEKGIALLHQHELNAYEVSAYTQNKPALHNLNYWQFGDYLGIGAGAHSKISNINDQIITRYHRHRSPKQYLQANLENRSFTAGTRVLTQEDLIFEFMLNGLRLSHGIDSTLLTERTGLTLLEIKPKLEQAYQRGLLLRDPKKLMPSPKGKAFLNDLISLFLEKQYD